MWKNMSGRQGTGDSEILHMRSVCWVIKSTYAHLGYLIRALVLEFLLIPNEYFLIL
jgi:hypothetical protein